MKLLGCSILLGGVFFWYNFSAATQPFPYKFEIPSAVLKLDDDLVEISGLSISSNDQHLLAVQDEIGWVFYLDKNSGEIVKKVEFWKDGDYEGIEGVGEDIYVLKSTGTVYWVKNADSSEPLTEKFNYDLNKDNDVEGLGYDRLNHQLLLACKAHPDGRKDVRGIYGFSLKNHQLLQDPVFLLNRQAIHDYLDKDPPIMRLEKVKDFFAEEDLDFSPSAIAVNPVNGTLYLLSSKGKMIVVMNRNNEVVYIQKLQKEEHPQPEGLCFDRKGNLYIANEGGGGKGTISVYKYASN